MPARLVAALALGSTLVRFRPGDRDRPARGAARAGSGWTCPVRVVADDGEVLAVLLEPGAPFTFHEHPFGPHPWRDHAAWGVTTVLQLHREGDAYSVWKLFDEGGVPLLVRELRGASRPARRRLRHRRPWSGPHRPPRRPTGVEGRRRPLRAGHERPDDRRGGRRRPARGRGGHRPAGRRGGAVVGRLVRLAPSDPGDVPAILRRIALALIYIPAMTADLRAPSTSRGWSARGG